MKKITLIISLIITTFSAYSQDIQINDGYQFKLPEGTVKLSLSEYLGIRQTQFGNPTDSTSLTDFHFFKKDGLIFYYHRLSTPAGFKPRIEGRNKTSVDITKKYQKETIIEDDKVITVNGFKVSILHYNKQGFHRILFSTDYNKENQFIGCFLEFMDADKDEAKKYLDEVLQSMKQE